MIIVRQLKMWQELQRQPRLSAVYGKLDIFRCKTGQMKAVIRQALLDYPDIFVFSDEEDFAPHILTFGIKGVRGEVIVHAL